MASCARVSKARIITATLASALTVAASLAMKWEPPPDTARMLVAIKPIPSDPWTICYGHTRGVYAGMTATMEQCNRWLQEDLLIANEAVERCITWPLQPPAHGAFIDAAFNIGPSVVCGSTLQRKANAGDIEGACRELTHAAQKDGRKLGWSFSAGKHYPGLRARRFDEYAYCWPDFSSVRAGATFTTLN